LSKLGYWNEIRGLFADMFVVTRHSECSISPSEQMSSLAQRVYLVALRVVPNSPQRVYLVAWRVDPNSPHRMFSSPSEWSICELATTSSCARLASCLVAICLFCVLVSFSHVSVLSRTLSQT